MLKSLRAVVIGIICSALIFMGLTMISRSFYPRPPEIAMDDKAAFAQFLQNQPLSEQIFLSFSFIICAFLGSYLSGRLSGIYRLWLGVAGGGFIFMMCVSVFLYMPYSKTYAAVTILGVMAAMGLGAYIGSRSSKPEA
jgi:hypothetical protein